MPANCPFCKPLPRSAQFDHFDPWPRYASGYARRHGAAVTLVLDKRIKVRFAKDGSLDEIIEALPPENPT